jgi:hypothetical protein
VTLAIALWLARSVSAALWVVEHVTLAVRARRRGAPLELAWSVPALPCWRAGDRVGPAAWYGLAAVYVAASALSATVR